jgi:hypothetical protein
MISERKLRDWIINSQPIYQDDRRSPYGQGIIWVLNQLEWALDHDLLEGDVEDENNA